MTRLRAVVDVNVLISAAIHPAGNPGRVVVRFLDRLEFDFVASEQLLAEFSTTIARPKIRRRIRATDEVLDAYVHDVTEAAVRAEPHEIRRVVPRDPDDDVVIATALAGDAGYVVTGDTDLLSLGSHAGVRIVTPREFLEILDAAAR